MQETQYVVLCDHQGQPIETKDKLQAHIDGDFHLAFSVQICRPAQDGRDGYEWLLQQRAMDKYHSGGLWANTCCSHPLVDEVMATQWFHADEIQAWLETKPEQFAVWFKEVFTRVSKHLK